MCMPVVKGVQFLPVVGLSGYAVGDDGSVWSCHTKNGTRNGWHAVSIYRRSYGSQYCHVSLRTNSGKGKVVCMYVHRIVLEAFVGPQPAGMVACHYDGDTANNRLANLRWGTQSENAEDKRRHGRMPLGSRHKNSKLTEDDVREIRRLWALNGMFNWEIGKRFGVSASTIQGIVVGKRWRHVGPDA